MNLSNALFFLLTIIMMMASTRDQGYETSIGIVASASIQTKFMVYRGNGRAARYPRAAVCWQCWCPLLPAKIKHIHFYSAQIQGITSTCNNWGDIFECCFHQQVIWRVCHGNLVLTPIVILQALGLLSWHQRGSMQIGSHALRDWYNFVVWQFNLPISITMQ
jgi:hypothetical protein